MNRHLHLITFSLVALSLFAVGCAKNNGAENTPATNTATTQTPEQHGEFLVRVGGCADCHASDHPGTGMPPGPLKGLSGHPASMKMGPAPALSGGWGFAGSMTSTAFAGPWGVSFAANLTPDSATGIGAWQVHNFIEAMRTGQFVANGHLAGRQIMPPMPWPALQGLSDSDLTAIFLYLRSQPAVSNKVPDYISPTGVSMPPPPAAGAPGQPTPPPPAVGSKPSAPPAKH